MNSDDLSKATLAAIGCVNAIQKIYRVPPFPPSDFTIGWEKLSDALDKMECVTCDIQMFFLNARKGNYRNPDFCGIHEPTAWNTTLRLAHEVNDLISQVVKDNGGGLDVLKCAHSLSLCMKLNYDELNSLLQELNTEHSWALTSLEEATLTEAEQRLPAKVDAKVEHGEGNGGVGLGSEQSVITSRADRGAILRGLQPADRKAYLSFQYAESKVGKKLEDREAYDILNEEDIPTDEGDLGELVDYKLPAFGTWAKQLRNARKPLGDQKYTCRGGRTAGQSIVSGREIEYRKGGQ
ncbi:MAG: hypothetical protein IT426_20775 [Pirellulales bacterium]|nr:hypothetical protein [Pirellulales bacterium]